MAATLEVRRVATAVEVVAAEVVAEATKPR
jgi:hypothetical protein